MGSHSHHPLLAVRETIAADPDGFTARFYTRLFATNPALRDMFPATMAHQREALWHVLNHVLESVPTETELPELIDFLGQLGRDHRKYGVTSAHYDQFLAALLAECAATMGGEWDEHTSEVTGQALMLTTGVMRGAATSAEGPASWTATVHEKYRMSRDLAVVRLIADAPLTYAAGQYLEVQIPQVPLVWRYLSPSIPPNPNGEIEFQVRSIPGGEFSSAIVNHTQAGDVWTFGQSLGSLSAHRTDPIVMIAGGTGYAPLRSLILELSARGDNPQCHLYYGADYPGELYDAGVLWQITAANPWLRVVPTSVHGENPWWLADNAIDLAPLDMTPRRGRAIDAVIDDATVQRIDLRASQILVSGPPAMVDDAVNQLTSFGVDPARIIHDPV